MSWPLSVSRWLRRKARPEVGDALIDGTVEEAAAARGIALRSNRIGLGEQAVICGLSASRQPHPLLRGLEKG